MVNAQENLNDNKDNLEKKSGTLSETEKGKLEKIKTNKDIIKEAQKTEIQINAKDGTIFKATALDAIRAIAEGVDLAAGTNYKAKLEKADIEINGKKIDNSQLGRGSELMAFLQVAAGGNLSPDGKFGPSTAKAFSELLPKQETSTVEKSIETKKVLNDKVMTRYIEETDIYDAALQNLSKKDAENFKSNGVVQEDNTFKNAEGKNKILTIYYNKNEKSMKIDYKNITTKDGAIDTKTLVTIIKDNILDRENRALADKLETSAKNSVKVISIASFSPAIVKEYLSAQVRKNKIEVKNGFIKVNVPLKGDLSYTLANYQKADKKTFDNAKFIADLTTRMDPIAKNWKKNELTARSNSVDGTKIGAITDANNVEKYINEYKNLGKTIDSYASQGVVLDKKVVDKVSTKIEELTNQKDYLRAKKWIDGDIKSLEDFFKLTGNDRKSNIEETAMKKRVKDVMGGLNSGTLFLQTPTKLNIKNAFIKTKKTTEFDTYLNRYKKLYDKVG